MSDRVDRNHVKASYWQFDPTEPDEGPEVEAMDAALSFVRSDEDRLLVSVRGKVRGRYEKSDAAWLEFSDEQVVRLIERLAATLDGGT